MAPAASASLSFTEFGAGPPLLLLHGLMATGEMFETVVDRLATRHRLIVPDLRGHGKSRSLPPPYTVRQLAADAAQLLDRLGVVSAAVLGYSQGGAVAQQFAADFPQKCHALVLGCTYAFNRAALREKIEGSVAPLLLRLLGPRRFAKFVVRAGAKELSRERADWLVRMMGDQDHQMMLAAWREAMAFDGRKRLTEIACPTLIVAGSTDHAVPAHHAEMLHRGIHGSHLLVIDGAGHTLIWTHPGEFARAVEDFLAAAEKRTRGNEA